MKKFALALAALAAFTGSAIAADLPPAPAYSNAPAVVPTPSWTGFYIFGGAGGGVWDANTGVSVTGGGPCVACFNNKQGGDGYFGTAGAGSPVRATTCGSAKDGCSAFSAMASSAA
jgi:outer membrane immunogenic protein